MKTRSIVIAVVVLALAVVSTASAIETGLPLSRYLGMAGAGLALTRDAAAVDMNPAALAAMELDGKAPGQFEFQIAGTAEVSGDQDIWSVNLAGGPAAGKWGFGFSYYDASPGAADWDGWTFGFGYEVQEDVILGASATDVDTGGIDDTIYNISALFPGEGIDWGVVINDITDETAAGPIYSAGAAFDIAPKWIGVFDAFDITDEIDQSFALGVEFAANDDLDLRAGMWEGGDFSAGVGFEFNRFSIDAAWMEMGDGIDDSIFITAATTL
jgi:hypothetical protein